MPNSRIFSAAAAALGFGRLGVFDLESAMPAHMRGERRKTMYYYHHPSAHNAGSHPVPGGGLRERHRHMVRSMLAEWRL
jgi:hypothetical protein